MNAKDRIKFVTDKEMYWDWDGSQPSYTTKTANAKYSGMHIKFDPFPCYMHKKDLVISEVKRVESIFPIGFETFYFVFPYEPIGRTNGQAYTNTVEYAEKEKGKMGTWDGGIDLYGKRIPLHPAMTRYLISHEYGHIVDNWICNQRKLDQDGLDKEYAKLRGIKLNQKYGGRKWHTNIGEIIANDFRIVVCKTETEFWPHTCVHPDKSKEVQKFWKDAIKNYARK